MNTKNLKANNNTWLHILEVLNKCTNISGKLGYVISRTKRNISRQLEPFEEQRMKLFQKYGSKTDDGKIFIDTTSENYQSFLNQLLPIAEQIIIEIPILQITQQDFESSEDLFNNNNIKVEDYDILQELLIQNQEKTEKEDIQEKEGEQ